MPVLGQTPTEAHLNDSTPAAPSGAANVKWQAGAPYPDPNNPVLEVRDISASLAGFQGDSGSGGTIGAVPAPAAGDAAFGRFLKADGTWLTPFGGAKLISSSYTIAVTDNNSLLVANASGAMTFTLPNPPPSPYWLVFVENPTPGTVTLSPNGLLLDGAAGTLNVGKNQGVMIATDGTNYYSERGMATGGGSGGGGGGTVTSVALTMPAEFAVAGSPITGFGTLAVTSNTEPANEVWAGPASGASATPAFRALVAGDIPPIPESGVINLVSDLAAKAPLASPALTGTPTAPTPATSDNSTKIATTAFVDAAIAASGGGAVPSTASANYIFAGPASGPAATPSFRAAVVADYPFHSESLTDGGGNFVFAGGDIVTVVGVPN